MTAYRLKGVVFRVHKSKLKPALTDKNKRDRVQHALSKIDITTNNPRKCRDLKGEVRVDEKWFFLTQDGECYILGMNKEPLQRPLKARGSSEGDVSLCNCKTKMGHYLQLLVQRKDRHLAYWRV